MSRSYPVEFAARFWIWLRRVVRSLRSPPRLGWRKAHAVACREGPVTNPERTRRLWRDEGPQRPPQRKAKRRRLSDGTAARLRAGCPNDVWALDFCFDETADLRRIKLLNVVDEFTREALAVNAAHSIDADGVVATAERLVTDRGAPTHLRMDNGPELISAALRDWCRIWGTLTAYIEPGSPWETPFIESFNGRLRDECLNTETSPTSSKPQVILEDWRIESRYAGDPPRGLGVLRRWGRWRSVHRLTGSGTALAAN